MVGLAIDGISSFSIAPLRLITFIGLIFAFLSLAVGIWVVVIRLFTACSSRTSRANAAATNVVKSFSQ
jgi:hypothetical protein